MAVALSVLSLAEAKWWVDAIPWLFVKGKVPFISVYCCEDDGFKPDIKRDQHIEVAGDFTSVQLRDNNDGTAAVIVHDTYGISTFRHEMYFARDYTLQCHGKRVNGTEVWFSMTPQVMTKNLMKLWDIANAIHVDAVYEGGSFRYLTEIAKDTGGLTPDSLRNVLVKKAHSASLLFEEKNKNNFVQNT